MRDKAIKVVHIVEPFQGGTGTHIRLILPELVRQGFDVTLICSLNRAEPQAQEDIVRLRQSGVKVEIVKMCRQVHPLRDFCSFVRIFRLLVKEQPDIVHTHCSKAGALGRIAAALASKSAIIHTPHCFAFTRCRGHISRLFIFLTEWLLGRLTTRLAVVSKAQAAAALRYHIVCGEKCVSISNGLPQQNCFSPTDRTAAKVSLGLDCGVLVVTTACRFVGYKGILTFLKAAGLSRTPNAVFIAAGDGELTGQAEKFIHTNNLTHKVKLLGHVSDMDQLYAASDIVALCSSAEAQPYVLLEAMRAKRPIVATRVTGNSQLISHGQTGVLSETNPAAIAAAVDNLLADETKRTTYAEKAYRYFLANHTLDRQVFELTQMYRNCIGTKQAKYEAQKRNSESI